MNALRRRELEIAGRAHSENLTEQRQKIIDMAPMPIYVKDASDHESRISADIPDQNEAIKLHDASTGDHVNRMADISALLGDPLIVDTLMDHLDDALGARG